MKNNEVLVTKNNSRVGMFGMYLAAFSLVWIVVSGLLIGFHVLADDSKVLVIGIWGLIIGWGLAWKTL